ncbi:MAG TPA: hypothetical protein VGR37_01805 [Longimicrobiaceae bacterium]|nr:hypothetical protein [Longimicrobiaceae bacterium]
MSAVDFSLLPGDARLWIFAAARPLAPDEAEALLGRVDRFVDGWLAHGHSVVGARDWRHDRFLLVAADERATGVSGCSIDSLFRVLKELEAETGAGLLDRSGVTFRGADGEIRTVSRPEFRALVQSGEVGADTAVFDNTITTVGELNAGRWEMPLRNSWHAKAFGVEGNGSA